MKFPTPLFQDLERCYRAEPGSAHLCARGLLSGDPSPTETGATRLSEALCIAAGLLESRAALATVDDHAGDQLGLLGPYRFRGDLCPHGLARNAAELATFLEEHWGRTLELTRPTGPSDAMAGKTGVIAFAGIHDDRANSHIDVWNGGGCAGVASWGCDRAVFWRLD